MPSRGRLKGVAVRAGVPTRPRGRRLAALVRDLAAALAPDRVRSGPAELALYRRDASIMVGEAAMVCFPLTTGEVAAAVRVSRAHGRPSCPGGRGPGWRAGPTPVGDTPPVVIVTTKMDRILEVDAEARVAWVQPGVLNLDLSRAVAPHGLHFAPDPSSQQSCTMGGNVANNSGGPHCLLYGVTSAHVLALEVVLPGRHGGPARRARPRPGRATTCGGPSSAARGPWASPPASPCA